MTRDIVLFLSLVLFWNPLTATTMQARVRFQNLQQPTSSTSAPQADRVKEFAVRLAEAKTEDQRAALLAQEKDLVTADLVRALSDQGRSLFNQGDDLQALTTLRLAQAIAEQIGDKAGRAGTLNNIGNIYSTQGHYNQALEYFQKSLLVSQEIGDKAGISQSLNHIGIAHRLQGNHPQALEFFQKSLELAEASGNKLGVAQAVNNIAVVYSRQGDYTRALEFYQKSLALVEALGHKAGIAFLLGNIGIVYVLQADYVQALEFYQKSLAIFEALKDKRGIGQTLTNIGMVYEGQGNYAQALEYYQKGLGLREALGDRAGIGHGLNNIGAVYGLQGNYILALENLQKSLTLREELGDKEGIAEVLDNIAMVYVSQGNYARALEFAERAANLARQLIIRRLLWNARTTSGRAYQALNHPAQARQAFEEAIAVVESLRSNVAGRESRATYFAKVQEPYNLYIDLLMQLHKERPSEGHDAVAFYTSERARARSLLEALSEARADIRRGVDFLLLQRERTLQQRLNAAAERQTRLLAGKHTEEQAGAAEKEIDALTNEYRQVEAQIRQSSPRYAALTQPVPLSLQEIQTTVLDADTLLLEYALGEERSYLWAVTPTSINSFELPKRSEIETAVRSAVSLLSDGKQWATSDKVESEYAKVVGRLSSMLLDPVAAQLKGKRLLIVGDGALQYLPFGALPSPFVQGAGVRGQGSGNAKTNRASTPNVRYPLIVEHEIVSLPSASTLAVLRRETANRTRPTKSIAVLADPVFERDDERVTANRTVSSQSAASAVKDTNSQTANSRYLLERAFGLGLQPATDEGGATREILRIPRLPFTRREAEAILATAPAGEGMKALDFRASRETAMNPELAQYRIVHLATHGLLNSEHPELSGIVLSLLNEAGEPVDGFLRLHEIYNLNLPADLVVLSACQTGLGKEIRGEGLVGLTRGFMYAGAPRVVASLWKVSDVATAELMKRFYQGMLREKMRPAAALRAAQIDMWKQRRWNAPFYWAAFQLQGEWR